MPTLLIRPTLRARNAAVAVLALLGLALAAVAVPADASAAKPKVRHTRSEQAMLKAVATELNLERASHGLSALRLNQDLTLSARRHNLTMARQNTMSHQCRGEAYFADRISRAGYRWQWAGENIGWNSDVSVNGVLALEKMMYNERPPQDGHRQNILSRHYVDVGVDVYFDRAHHKVWLTTDFGHR